MCLSLESCHFATCVGTPAVPVTVCVRLQRVLPHTQQPLVANQQPFVHGLCFVTQLLQVCYPRRWLHPYTQPGPYSTSTTASSRTAAPTITSPPYSEAAVAAAPGRQPDASGMCADPQPGVLLPRAYPTPWPTPAAYYPLAEVCQGGMQP